MSFSRKKYNPLEIAKNIWPTIEDKHLSHITYDENFRKEDRDFYIIRQSSHDGTLIFSRELFLKALINLIKKESVPASWIQDESRKLIDIRYIVGPLYDFSAFGIVNLPAGTYPGEVERVKMAVKVVFVYENT